MENKIERAKRMIENHDFLWFLCDLGYHEQKDRAEREMKAFVALVKTIPDNYVQEELRGEWVAAYRKQRSYLAKMY